MTVAELIAALQKMPQDLPVGYVNRCADEGANFTEAGEPRLFSGERDYWTTDFDFPRPGAVVLG